MKNKITIVGTEPSKKQSIKSKYSVNIEALLLMVKFNKTFRKEFLSNCEKTIQECCIELTNNEIR